MTDTVEMTKRNGAAWATANVPADAVLTWEADGWKVVAKGKANAKRDQA